MTTASAKLVSSLGDAKVAAYLKEQIASATRCFMAVAYGSYAAFTRLQPGFTDLMMRNGELRVLLDVQGLATDPQLVEEFATIPGDCQCKVFVGEKGRGAARAFHPKIYYFEASTEVNILVGSSNFTDGGLAANIEANVAIGCGVDGAFARSVRAVWDRVWESNGSIFPTSTFLDGYRGLVTDSRPAVRAAEGAGAKRLAALVAQERQRAGSPASPTVAYLLGLVAGGGRFTDENRSAFAIRKESRQRTGAGTVPGVISAPGITGYSVSQAEATQTDAARITGYIDAWLRATAQGAASYEMHGEYSYSINATLAPGSPAFDAVEQYVAAGVVDRGRFFPRSFPILEGHQLAGANQSEFIKGYFDIRGRVSVTDRLPNHALRIAVSISSPRSDEFGRALQSAFQEQFRISDVNYEEGTSRGRESILRIDARDLPPRLFTSHWQSILHHEFAAYNQQHFPR